MTFRFFDDNAFGYMNGPDEKVVRFVAGGGGMSGVNRDAQADRYFPADGAQWATTLSVAGVSHGGPAHLWIPGAGASGAIVDVIGGKDLNVSGSPLYQQSIAGFDTKCVTANGGATNQFFNNGTMENASSVSILVLAIVAWNQGASNREIMYHGGAGSNAFECSGGTQHLRYRNSGNSSNGTLNNATSVVRPVWLRHNIAASVQGVISDIERLDVTYNAVASGALFQIQVGLSTESASFASFLHVTEWVDTAAEWTDADIKAVTQTLNWPFTAY